MYSTHRSLSSLFLTLATLLIGAALFPAATVAQSPTPAATVKNSNGTVRLQSFFDGGLLLPGVSSPTTPNDSIPVEGAGTRLMWYPAKAAFRAGEVGRVKNSEGWNATNVGLWSVAFGRDTKATGLGATAMGDRTTSTADYTTAMGIGTSAGGQGATAMGQFSTASAEGATAIGDGATAATNHSHSIGECNDKNRGNDDDKADTGPLFVVGNGQFGSVSCDSRSDALILDQSGNLEVTGSFVLPDGTILDGSEDLGGGLSTNDNGASAVSNDDGLIATGTFDSGSIPTSGASTRMMWYPNKAAFRAGRVFDNSPAVDGSDFWDASNVGDYSVALGKNTKASGNTSVAMGKGATATANYGATAMGNETTASALSATAMGVLTTASGATATAMGNETTASGVQATAMGGHTTASAAAATAMGEFTTAATNQSFSIGECNDKNRGNDDNDPATGPLLVAGNGNATGGSCDSRSDALILDQGGNLEVTGSFVLPDGTTLDEGSDISGLPTNSNGATEVSNTDGFIATGTTDSGAIPASGEGTRMMWYPNQAAFRAGGVTGSEWDDSNIGSYSVAMGLATTAKGTGDVAIGIGTLADGGSGTVASGGAVALGNDTKATAAGATAFGYFTTASGLEATAMGYNTTAATDVSLSIGEYNSANTSADNTLFVAGNGTGSSSLSDALVLDKDAGLLVNGELGTGSIPATGSGTRMMWYPGKAALRAGRVGNDKDGTQWDDDKVGKYSVAFGVDTKASGILTTAMGEETVASGPGATALGFSTTASGKQSTAMGDRTTAGASDATALGLRTQAQTPQSFSIGECNASNRSDDNTLFVVGNGTLSSGVCAVSDALVVDEGGNLGIGGNLSIGGVVNNDVGGGPAMHFQREFGGADDNPQDYVTLIENTVGELGDGLAIKAGEATTPGKDVNYIGFFQGDGDPAGKIQGDEFGGVMYESTGSDYAEELPIAEESSKPEAADLVGVQSGEASLETDGTARVMIVSTAPIMLGNADPSTELDDDGRVEVAFIGQVPTRVRGKVETGDLIVASGKEDGTGRAVSPGEYRRATHGPIAGQAWSDKSSEEVGKVTVAVGLGRSGAVAKRLQAQQAQIEKKNEQIATLRANQKKIQKRLAALETGRSPSVVAGLSGTSAALLLAFLCGGLLGAGLLHLRRSPNVE